jgi:predicted  nucleic acid-binding Zn-ribbon protein
MRMPRGRRIAKLKEEIELLKLQLRAREAELGELRKEVEELHRSISYRVGRWIAETWWGARLKAFLRKYIFK